MNERKIMGLAAGQARLLTITGRKSDCEFESMRLSHQKIALARELADLSNQYQDSLDVTKLVYDYYGTGDTNTPFSYGICMTPSILNDYLPILLTDSMGRVVLDSKYAAAAREAGIPQEGLGTLPSETVRNAFIEKLYGNKIISEYMRDKITSLPYSQGIGLGGGATAAVITEQGPFEEFCKHLSEIGDTITVTTPNKNTIGTIHGGSNHDLNFWYTNASDGTSKLPDDSVNCHELTTSDVKNFSLANLLDGSSDACFMFYIKDTTSPCQEMFNATQASVEDVINQIGTIFEDVLSIDDYSAKAMEYATQRIKDMYVPLSDDGINYSTDAIKMYSDSKTDWKIVNNYVGWAGWPVGYSNGVLGTGIGGHHSENRNGISISNMAVAYLTFFADFMNGVSATNAYNQQIFDVKKGEKKESHKLASAYPNNTFDYVWKTGVEVSSDDLGQAKFYDALFNQLCLNGWVENDNVKDNDYLQKMLENGMMYVTKVKDDGYYYQGNYATDSYIKVVADERKIAAAEAKYNTEKAKLNAKEQTLDMKMKNLDTEISSLTTEYDTIKNTLSKNIERGFKRYSA